MTVVQQPIENRGGHDAVAARDALRAVLGDVQLIDENGAVYAERDNAAERLLLAVGGVSMGRVAGGGFGTYDERWIALIA